MKVLYLTYDGLTDPLGQSQILPYLIGCQGGEHDISIISFEKKEAYESNSLKIHELLKKNSIKWTALPYTKSPPVLSTIKDLRQLTKSVENLFQKEPFDLIHCRSYVTAYIAFKLKRKFGFKVLFDIRGFWIDERIEGGIWNKNNPIFGFLYKYLKKKESMWFEESDGIISLTDKAKSYIHKTFRPVTLDKIKVIPCCTDTQLFDPQQINVSSQNSLKMKLKIDQHDRIIGYVGSLGTWYMYKEMLQTFKHFYENNLVQKFLVITRDDPSQFEAEISEIGLPDSSVIIKSTAREEMPLYMSLMHIGLFYIRPTFSKMASSPTKLGEYLSMGIPIITNSGIGDLDDFLIKNKVGMCIDVNSINIDLKDVSTLLNLDPNEIRAAAVQHLSLKKGIESYLEVYKQLS